MAAVGSTIGIVRRPGGSLDQGLEPLKVAQALGEEGALGWVDLEAPAEEEVHALEGLFGFHPLALEDALNSDTRPKIEEYENFLFVVTRAVNHNPGESALDLIPLFAFVNRHVIVTVHPRPLPGVATALDRLCKHPDVLRHGPDRLLHHLLDQVVDHYFPIVEELEDRIEDLQDRVFAQPEPGQLAEIFQCRKEGVALRRSLSPLREVVTNLMSGVPYVDDDLRPFFRDVYDHVMRILDQIETNRDILAGLLESYLSQVNNRMSAVMKRLTILTAIGLPMTIISGFFGMNFEEMPWLKSPWGVSAATALMVAVSVGIYAFFWWRRWL